VSRVHSRTRQTNRWGVLRRPLCVSITDRSSDSFGRFQQISELVLSTRSGRSACNRLEISLRWKDLRNVEWFSVTRRSSVQRSCLVGRLVTCTINRRANDRSVSVELKKPYGCFVHTGLRDIKSIAEDVPIAPGEPQHPCAAGAHRRTFNSGSFHSISNGEDPESKEISGQCLCSTYLLFIVRSRNSRINDPIRSNSSSNAKWPVSRRWSSALGISLLMSSAPSTVKIPSFLPHVISVGG
jgi:hypothetical protein